MFEQFRVGEYHYQGEAYLSGSPYQETQPDTDGKDRSVWMFPLKLLEGEPIPEAQEKYKERYELDTMKSDLDALKSDMEEIKSLLKSLARN